jgi:hypothetical protein
LEYLPSDDRNEAIHPDPFTPARYSKPVSMSPVDAIHIVDSARRFTAAGSSAPFQNYCNASWPGRKLGANCAPDWRIAERTEGISVSD